jgi:hypothetical protein
VANVTSAEIAHRAEDLLWVIARADVENLQSHRETALRQLRDLESAAFALNIPDLYQEVLRAKS